MSGFLPFTEPAASVGKPAREVMNFDGEEHQQRRKEIVLFRNEDESRKSYYIRSGLRKI